MKIPKPETLSALLWSDSLQKPTQHHYDRTDPVDVEGDHDSLGRCKQSFEHVFRCAETGAERRFGMESARLRKCVP